MLMSLFSTFDAVSAESLGQKVGLSARAPPPPVKRDSAPVKVDEVNKGKEVKPSPPPAKRPEDRQSRRFLRFAPELDGIDCFETIIPY